MFYVRTNMHTFVMNKFGPESKLLEIVTAEDRHPDRSDGKPQRFSPWQQPLVKVGEIYGTAVAYKRSYGLIVWEDPDRTYRPEWFHAHIKRVERENWHGR